MVYKRRLESVSVRKNVLENKEGKKSRHGTKKKTEECAV
jgi:hypothetical protein